MVELNGLCTNWMAPLPAYEHSGSRGRSLTHNQSGVLLCVWNFLYITPRCRAFRHPCFGGMNILCNIGFDVLVTFLAVRNDNVCFNREVRLVENIAVFIEELEVARGSVEGNMKTINATAQGIRHIIIGSIGIRVEVYRRVPIQTVDRERHIVCIFHSIKGISKINIIRIIYIGDDDFMSVKIISL